MLRVRRSASINRLAGQKAQDDIWGMPESPEFSSVERLICEFQSHASREEHWLSSYKEAAAESQDPLVRYLFDLIVTDEERHHGLIGRMISKLKDELAWTLAAGASRRLTDSSETNQRLLAAIERFLDAERQGIEHPSALSRGITRLSTRSRLSLFRHSGGGRNPSDSLNFTEANLDAGLRRHDEISLRLKARDFNHPRRRH